MPAAAASDCSPREQRRPDAAVAEFGHERDVDDADFVLLARDVEPPGRLAVHEDDVERRARVVLLVVGVLGVELHLDEHGLLRGVPLHRGELGLAGTRADQQECLAVLSD